MWESLWKVTWRSVILLILFYVFWQVPTRIPPILAENSLNKGADIFRNLTKEQSFLDWLTKTEWSELKIRNRGDIAGYYDSGVRGRDESKKRLNLVKTSLSEVTFPSNDPNFYNKLNADLRSANDQLNADKELYQILFEYFSYYEQSTLALFNFLYYDPSVTIKFYRQSPDYEMLLQRFGLDYVGLQKVEEKLQNLAPYKNDNLAVFALPLVRPLTIKAKQISDLAGQRRESEALILAEEFDREVLSTQEIIAENRREFWKSLDKKSLIIKLTELGTKDREIRSKLENKLIELSHRK